MGLYLLVIVSSYLTPQYVRDSLVLIVIQDGGPSFLQGRLGTFDHSRWRTQVLVLTVNKTESVLLLFKSVHALIGQGFKKVESLNIVFADEILFFCPSKTRKLVRLMIIIVCIPCRWKTFLCNAGIKQEFVEEYAQLFEESWYVFLCILSTDTVVLRKYILLSLFKKYCVEDLK